MALFILTLLSHTLCSSCFITNFCFLFVSVFHWQATIMGPVSIHSATASVALLKVLLEINIRTHCDRIVLSLFFYSQDLNSWVMLSKQANVVSQRFQLTAALVFNFIFHFACFHLSLLHLLMRWMDFSPCLRMTVLTRAGFSSWPYTSPQTTPSNRQR